MKTPEQLDDFLTDVLHEALPKGIYRFWEIPNPQGLPAAARLKEYLQDWQETQQEASRQGNRIAQAPKDEALPLTLTAIAPWKPVCQAKFEEWRHFGPGPAASPECQATFNQLTEDFLKDLEALLQQSKLKGSYLLEDPSKHDASWYLTYAPWSDQLNFDIFLETEIALYVMHYGWSS